MKSERRGRRHFRTATSKAQNKSVIKKSPIRRYEKDTAPRGADTGVKIAVPEQEQYRCCGHAT
jgi:hypothetical protein